MTKKQNEDLSNQIVEDNKKSVKNNISNLKKYKLEARDYINKMISAGAVDSNDKSLIDMFINHYSVWKSAMADIEINGQIVLTPRYFVQKNPSLTIAEMQAGVLQKIIANLGLSARARQEMKIKLNEESSIDDLTK